LSDAKGDKLNLYFLIIENKFSKHGYHNNKTINRGDIFTLYLYISIDNTPKINPKKYEPPSPM
tara:strand:+ start:266 stop:454 length:189 start_codon:yes stop_codon:yes gene_type:complete